MVLTAVRGALAFLTRLPVGGGRRAWDGFRTTPAAFVLAGYAVGALVALPLALPAPPAAAAAYLLAVYLVTGVTHADGLADLGDAAAVHRAAGGEPGADRERRRAAMTDAAIGAGGVLALTVALAALALGALALADGGIRVALTIALLAEVSAKAGMALLACLGPAAGDGLGAAVVAGRRASLPSVGAALLPAALLVTVVGAPAVVATVLAGPAAATAVRAWAVDRLGGISGDVLGGANELGRVAAIHAGVVAWTLS